MIYLPEFAVKRYALIRKLNSFQIFQKISKEISVPSTKVPKTLVEWKAPHIYICMRAFL